MEQALLVGEHSDLTWYVCGKSTGKGLDKEKSGTGQTQGKTNSAELFSLLLLPF